MPLELQLLGAPQVHDGSNRVLITPNNPSLLLLYLAYRNDWVSRGELAFLFRPDEDEATAKKHLRLLLHRAKNLPWAEALAIHREQLKLALPTDVQTFKTALQDQDWEHAIHLYSGSFLSDISAPDAPTYNAWLELERSDLQAAYQTSLANYASALEAKGDYETASEVLAKLLKQDDLAEEIVQRYIKAMYLAGHRDRALKIYADFCKLLDEELEAEPLEATQELAKTIRDAKPLAEVSPVKQQRVSLKLPSQSTRFVGRKRELSEAAKLLTNPDCRLLTLLGMGGTGKTRLAIELARGQSFKDGVYFVPLAPLTSSESLMSAVASVLELSLNATQDPELQIGNYLRDKNVLLVLDNFEHLLDAAPLLTDLLQTAPDLKLLVTSRQRLNISSEWLFDVEGLAYPKTSEDDFNDYDAVELFINGVKRVAPTVILAEKDVAAIADMTRKLEGLPLAIELASSWVRIIPVTRIAAEFDKGYDLLETDFSDLPERHRSLKALLNKTWEALSEKKKEVLAKLSVFVGGCTLEAAEAVADTHFSILLTLVNESLLRRVPPDRFDMHELVKHYAHEKLEQEQTTEGRHADYFAALATKGGKELCMGKDFSWQTVFSVDYDNFTTALRGNLTKENAARSSELCAGLWFFWFTTSRYREGISFCQEALKLSSQESEAKAETLNGLGALTSRINLEEAKPYLEHALTMSQKLGFKYGEQNALANLGIIVRNQNDLPTAEAYLLKVLTMREELGYGVQQVIHDLGSILYSQGKFQEAERYYQRSLEISEKNANAHEIAITKGSLANVAMKRGDYQRAEALLLENKVYCEAVGDTARLAYAEITLGAVAYHQGNHAKARGFYQTALALGKEVSWTF